ncbi:MAG: hypothetical protein WCL32_15300, partial [Planctomycetota bacterium]
DRFDALLDGLAAGLNDAIADAVRDGTRLALKDAVIEILTDPTLRAKLRDATEPVRAAPEPAKKPSFWQVAKARVAAAGRALKAGGQAVATSVATAAMSVALAVRNPAQIAVVVNSLKHLVWVGGCAGLSIAVVSYFAPHMISAGLSGITAAAAAISIRAGNWTRRSFQAAVA